MSGDAGGCTLSRSRRRERPCSNTGSLRRKRNEGFTNAGLSRVPSLSGPSVELNSAQGGRRCCRLWGEAITISLTGAGSFRRRRRARAGFLRCRRAIRRIAVRRTCLAYFALRVAHVREGLRWSGRERALLMTISIQDQQTSMSASRRFKNSRRGAASANTRAAFERLRPASRDSRKCTVRTR